jgi:trigger factor
VLGQAEVTDSEGNKVDLSDFVRPAGQDEAAAAEEEAADDASEVVPSDDPAAVKF